MVFCVEVKCDILVRMGIDRGCLGMIIFRPVEEEVLKFGENYVMRNCMSCVLHLVLLECRFQKDEMGRACRNTFVVGNPEVWRHVE